MIDGVKTVLVVDDEPDIRLVVRTALLDVGCEVRLASSAAEALDSIAKHGLPHLAVLDIMMPGTDGLTLAKQILKFSDLPIIMLSAVDQPETIVSAIEEVAEDYVIKPFRPDELAARVSRVLRRMGDFGYALAPTITVDSRLSVDLAGRSAYVEGGRRALTPTETKILHILVRSSGRPVSTDFLLSRVWPLAEVYEDTLRVHIHRLRSKIERDASNPEYLVTERGLGYCFYPNEVG